MSIQLFATLLLSLSFAACSGSRGTGAVAVGPQAPINEPDTRVIVPDAAPGELAGAPSGSSNSPAYGTSTGLPSSNGGGTAGGSPVPEPGTMLLFGAGLAGYAALSLRRRRRED